MLLSCPQTMNSKRHYESVYHTPREGENIYVPILYQNILCGGLLACDMSRTQQIDVLISRVKTTWAAHIHFTFMAAAILLNLWEISEKEGLSEGSDAQQLSIRAFHSGSHQAGICGRKELFTIPPIIEAQCMSA